MRRRFGRGGTRFAVAAAWLGGALVAGPLAGAFASADDGGSLGTGIALAAASSAGEPAAASSGTPEALSAGDAEALRAGEAAGAEAASAVGSEEDARIVHLLSRAAFGPTRSLVSEVRSLGRRRWVERQLDPAAIDDPELADRLRAYSTLEMSSADLLAAYPKPEPGEQPDPLEGPNRPLFDLAASIVVRAVHARAQLVEVLADFWLNHFNVYAPEDPTRWTMTAYLRDAIRPHVLGRFEDLLRATAESPAMLHYLNNDQSVAKGTRGPGSGINENYGRELMELHTLGVDGGYAQADVIAVARAFTGWTITPPRSGDLSFLFRGAWHDRKPKSVLGTKLTRTGKDEGDEVLHLLATHPSTAGFVARKLVARLVDDDPPEALVASAARVFADSEGDLAAVVREILTSAELYARAHRGAKVRTPLEQVASWLRASGSRVESGYEAARLVGRLGQPMLQAHPPTGWSETAPELVSAGGMLARFDAAWRIASGTLPGVETDTAQWARWLGTQRDTKALARRLLQAEPSAATAAALAEASAAGASPALLAALVLASPEFQVQ